MARTLNQNEIYSAISNLIFAVQSYGFGISNEYTKFVDRARVDGTLYGDTKEIIYTGDLFPEDWLGDAEAQNMLQINRAEVLGVDYIVMDVFKKIALTVDDYMTKRGFLTPTEFSEFNAQLNKQINVTKSEYDANIFNTYLGVVKSTVQGGGNGYVEVDLAETAGLTGNEKNRVEGQLIANKMVNIEDEMCDENTYYNDLGALRMYDKNDIYFVWNNYWVNRIEKNDTPTIFHDSKLFNGFADKMNSRLFGDVNTTATAGDGDKVRALDYLKLTDANNVTKRIKAGQPIPVGFTAPAGKSYTVNTNIIGKWYHKDVLQYMSAFTAAREFPLGPALAVNKWLVFGHNTLQYLRGFPFLELRAKQVVEDNENEGEGEGE